MSALARSNVTLSGPEGGQPLMFAHGFGCDQHMWRFVVPAFEADYRIVLFDLVGMGHSDPTAYDRERHSSLEGYAADVLDIVHELDLDRIVFVGHSVSAMIGALAAAEEPERFDRLVMVGPSPRYIDDDGTSVASAGPTSTSCSSRWRATTWGGRARWRR